MKIVAYLIIVLLIGAIAGLLVYEVTGLFKSIKKYRKQKKSKENPIDDSSTKKGE